MRLELNVPVSSLWCGGDNLAVQSTAPVNIFQEKYSSPVDFLNALSFYLADKAASARGIGMVFLCDDNRFNYYRGITLNVAEVNLAFSALPDQDHYSVKLLIDRLERAYRSKPLHFEAIYVYNFSYMPNTAEGYFGCRVAGR